MGPASSSEADPYLCLSLLRMKFDLWFTFLWVLSLRDKSSAYSPGYLDRIRSSSALHSNFQCHHRPTFRSHIHSRVHILQSRYSQDSGDGVRNDEIESVRYDQDMLSNQLLLAVESLGYHSGAVYMNNKCQDKKKHYDEIETYVDTVENRNFESGIEPKQNLQLLCEYTSPPYADKPTGILISYEIIAEDGMNLGILVFIECRNRENIGRNSANDTQKSLRYDEAERKERLLGSVLSSVRISLCKLRTYSSNYGTNTATVGQIVDETVAREAQSMILTSRTMLKMLARRVRQSDEIGNELIDNVSIQLDGLSSLLSRRNSGTSSIGIDSTGCEVSSIIAEVGDEYASESNLPLSIKSFRSEETNIGELENNTCAESSEVFMGSIRNIDDEFWSPSKREEIVSLDDDSSRIEEELNEHVDSLPDSGVDMED